jgi:polysaccharide export outer membrane protein
VAHGQATLTPRPAPVPDYTLGISDQIVIHVTDLDDISDKPLRVDPNGFIDLPLVGRVQASGETIEQLKGELAVKLSKYINFPQIAINLTDDKGHPVSVIGEVNNPGVQQVQGSKHLLEVLSVAGGVKADAGSTVIVTRQMKWGKFTQAGASFDPTQGVSTLTLPLDSLLNSKNPQENVVIEPNDVISVPKADIVYVLGNVKKSGGFPLPTKGNISLLQALSLAEGLDPNAKATKARILRPAPNGDGKPGDIPVDITKIYRGEAADVPLFANDVLFVPNSAIKANAQHAADAILAITTGLIIYRR